MKRCPTCQRTFTDETLSFCLDDGTPLLDASGGPQSYGPNVNIKPPQSMAGAPAPTIAYRATPETNQANAGWQQGPSTPLPPPPARKRRVWPWVLGVLGVLSVLGIGFIVLIIALASMGANTNNSNNSANANGNSRNKNSYNASASSNSNANANTNASNTNSQNSSDPKSLSASDNSAQPKSDVHITSLNMARDDGNGGAGETVDSFSPSDRTVYCTVHLSKLKAGTKVKFSWYVVDAGGMENKLLKELEYSTNSFENIVNAHLTLPQDWPTGDYRVDVSVNDGPPQSVEYSVE